MLLQKFLQIKIIKLSKILFAGSIILFMMAGCTSLKGYQKAYLNDPDMKLSKRKIERFETNAHIYREGAAGANGGKTGGGCGCN